MNENIAAQAGLLVGERYRPLSGRSGRARRATSTLFLVDGMTFGTWAALIPFFQQKFSLSEMQLSWVLLGLVVGALISMPLIGRVIAGWGSRAIAFPAVLAFCSALTLLALAPNYAALVAAALLFGALKGAVDVSINAQAITVENAIGKPIMSSFQAFWSFGGLAAAFFLSVAMNRGFSSGPLMLTMAVVFLVLTLSTSGKLLPDRSPSRGESPGFSLPDSKLLRLGGLAFLALFSEGVLLDWSAVYARSVANMSLATAPMAFAAFALSMAVGRFVGDHWIGRFGPIAMLRFSGLLMALGVGIAVLVPAWPAVLVGFTTTGLGIANLVPILFGAAGRAHRDGAGPGLATVTTIGYFGFLSGPPVIAALAAFAGLPLAILMVVVFGTIVATFGVTVIRPSLKTW